MNGKNRKSAVVSLICGALASFVFAITLNVGGNFKVSASEAQYEISFYAANEVKSNYVYYDLDYSGSHETSTEAYIYGKNANAVNRFNPSKSSEVALVWTAPADGVLNAVDNACTVTLNKGGVRTSTNPDGIRYFVTKLGEGNFQTVSGDYVDGYRSLEYKAGEETQADFGDMIKDVALKKGESVALIINCGGNANMSYDEATIAAVYAFTYNGGTTTNYEFKDSYLAEQIKSLGNNEKFSLGGENVGYYSWGTATIEVAKLRPSDTVDEEQNLGDYRGVYFYNANSAVTLQSGAVSYVYSDYDGNGKHASANEPFVYADNRFNPSQTSDAALWWTAPANGVVTLEANSFTITLNAKKRAESVKQSGDEIIRNTDGIRYAIIKVDVGGKITPLTVNLWNDLDFKDKEPTVAAFGGKSIELSAGEKIAIVVNCGTSGKNTYDEAALTANFVFATEDGESNRYVFRNSWITEHGKAILSNSEFDLGGEQTSYFAWGEALFDKERETFSVEGAYAFGSVEQVAMEWEGTKWYGGVQCEAKPDKVSEKTGKYPWVRIHPNFGKNVAATFTATEDCVAAITRLHLSKSLSTDRQADGVRWAIVYKKIDENGEPKYYSVNKTVWTVHEISRKEVIIKTHTDFPEIELKAGEQLMVVFDNNKVTGYDTIAVQIDLQYRSLASGELKRCNLLDEVVPNETQTYEHWSFNYLKMGKDYSSTVVGEAQDVEFESVGEFETEDLFYDVGAKAWVADEYPDIACETADNLYYITPDENMAVAVALRIGKVGRIVIDTDSYIRLLNDGSSNGVRFRVMKNDEIIYPSQNGWKYAREDKKISLSDIPVIEITEDDVIYFVLDAYGDAQSDMTECDFVVHFAEDGANYTESYILSDSFGSTERNGWSYRSISFANEPYSGVFEAVESSGCSSSVHTEVFALVPVLAALFLTEKIKRGRKTR